MGSQANVRERLEVIIWSIDPSYLWENDWWRFVANGSSADTRSANVESMILQRFLAIF